MFQKTSLLNRKWRKTKQAGTFISVLAVCLAVLFLGAYTLDISWQWGRVTQYLLSFDDTTGTWLLGTFIDGLLMTLRLVASAMLPAFGFGLVAALFKLSPSRVARFVSSFYVETIRNTPLLVQILLFYQMGSLFFGWSPFVSAVFALAFFEGAYLAEIFRAGILAVPKGQWEVSQSLGMNFVSMFVWVIFPQAFVRIIPPLTSQLVALIKDSSLVSFIAIAELSYQATLAYSETLRPFEVWLIVAGLYLCLTLTVSALASWVEQRYCQPFYR